MVQNGSEEQKALLKGWTDNLKVVGTKSTHLGI